MLKQARGYIKSSVQEKTGFPRFRLAVLNENGKSWRELGQPGEVQAVFNQAVNDFCEALMTLSRLVHARGLVQRLIFSWFVSLVEMAVPKGFCTDLTAKDACHFGIPIR